MHNSGSATLRLEPCESDGNRPNYLKGFWKRYRNWALKNEQIITLLDEAFGRLLFWTPLGEEDESSRFREAVWGCLQLHRLAFDVATNHSPPEQSYGTSVALNPGFSRISVIGLRIGISILQSLWPVAQEFARDASDSKRTARRQARVRLVIERIRFVLRFSILASYWYSTRNNVVANPGVLMQGGLYRNVKAPSFAEEEVRIARLSYVGRRTGRRLSAGSEVGISSWTKWRVLVGEILYMSRPLLTAGADWRCRKRVPVGIWLVCLLMDLLSLKSLARAGCEGNVLTKEEIRRRKLRLLVYLLRSPVWDQTTRPTVERIFSPIQNIPLIGSLASNYVWEFLLYWKLYGAEEG